MNWQLNNNSRITNIILERILDKNLNVILYCSPKVLQKLELRINSIILHSKTLKNIKNISKLEVFRLIILIDKHIFDLVVLFIKENLDLYPMLYESQKKFKRQCRHLKKVFYKPENRVLLNAWFLKLYSKKNELKLHEDKTWNIWEESFLQIPFDLKKSLITIIENNDNFYESFTNFVMNKFLRKFFSPLLKNHDFEEVYIAGVNMLRKNRGFTLKELMMKIIEKLRTEEINLTLKMFKKKIKI